MKNVLTSLVVSVAVICGASSAYAASCTCSDENVGGGHVATVSNARVSEAACTTGRILAYLDSLPGVDFQPGASCTYHK
jgi:hypothetical protein